MGGAAAAIVAEDMEAIEAEAAHDAELIGGHCAEGVVRAVGKASRLGRIAVAAQIRTNDGEMFGEPRRHPSPHRAALGKAMQQEHRRALAADLEGDLDAVDGEDVVMEAFEHLRCLLPCALAPD